MICGESSITRAKPWVLLRELRRQQGLTQKELAHGVISQTIYSFIEQGVIMPSDEVILNLARRLDTSVLRLQTDWRPHRQIVWLKSGLWRMFRQCDSAGLARLLEEPLVPHIDFMCYCTWCDAANLPACELQARLAEAREAFHNTTPVYVPDSLSVFGDLRLYIALALTEGAYMMKCCRHRSAAIWDLKASYLLRQIPSIWQ